MFHFFLAKISESYARCGGTANVICGSETDLSLAVKKEVMVSDTTANNGNLSFFSSLLLFALVYICTFFSF